MQVNEDQQHHAHRPPGGGTGFLVGTAVVVLVSIAFAAGFKSHEGMAKASIDDFGKIKLQDHIYDATLLRAPYEPETVTVAEMKARSAKSEAEE